MQRLCRPGNSREKGGHCRWSRISPEETECVQAYHSPNGSPGHGTKASFTHGLSAPCILPVVPINKFGLIFDSPLLFISLSRHQEISPPSKYLENPLPSPFTHYYSAHHPFSGPVLSVKLSIMVLLKHMWNLTLLLKTYNSPSVRSESNSSICSYCYCCDLVIDQLLCSFPSLAPCEHIQKEQPYIYKSCEISTHLF